jgi:small subunit ribosomal protein S1
VVRAAVVSVDSETRRLKLSMKALEATPADHFMEGIAVGDRVTGRILKVSGNRVTVQLGEGVEGVCHVQSDTSSSPAAASSGSLADKLAAAWKGGVKSPSEGSAEPYREGELRSFTIKSIDAANKKIELSPA